MSRRIGKVERKTKETDIKVIINMDGKGDSDINTKIPFLDHMLTLFSKHGLFDLVIEAKGDLEVDFHHTNEDIGIALGEVINKALGNRKKIKRFGFFCVPMDESLVMITLDLSRRPSLYISNSVDTKNLSGQSYNFNYAKHFLKSMFTKLGANVNINILEGKDFHHILEALFKCLGIVLDQATSIDERIQGIPSTKGKL